MKNLASRLSLGLACSLTILAGCVLIPYAGIQMDEALFAGPYYQPVVREFRLRVFHHDVPLMVMSYIGTLKTLLFWPLIATFRSGFQANPLLAAWVVRLPTVLAGALTVWIFFYLAERSVGPKTALAAAFLMASDPTFLLTNTFDWGPVALEHILLVTACFFLVKYAQDSSQRDLVLGFLFLGLALWYKAVFVWALAGLICAALSVFGRELSKMITRRRLALAAAGLLLGALPFAIYNGHRRAETFRNNGHLDPRIAPAKFIHVRGALGGYGLFGYIVSEENADNPKPAASLRGRAAVFIRDHLGEHRTSGMEYATALALLAFPLWWRSRAAWFSLVFCAVAWFFMASTKDAGASVHHTVLLWPFPQLFVAVVIGSIPWRWLAGSLCVILVAMNLLVVNQYIAQFERDGADGPYSDAIYPLSTALSEIPGQTIYVLDWGIQFPLDILHNGRLHMVSGHDPFMTDDAFRNRANARPRGCSPTAAGLFIAPRREAREFRRRPPAFRSSRCRVWLPRGPAVTTVPIPTAAPFSRSSNSPAKQGAGNSMRMLERWLEEFPRRLTGFLDLGCGSGSLRPLLARLNVIGMDVDRKALAQASFPRACAESHRLPFAGQSFDLVICHHSLEHLADIPGTIAEIRRVLRPEGRLFVSVPDGMSFSDRLYRFLLCGGGHLQRFTFASIVAAIESGTGLHLAGSKELASSFIFVDQRNFVPAPRGALPGPLPRRMRWMGILPSWCFSSARMILNIVTRSRYGWALTFTPGKGTPEEEPVTRNVCMSCGAGIDEPAIRVAWPYSTAAHIAPA